jgi:predicted Rossmann fold nucleotide-binding protein DprA/Smf involved in DNA uptake
MSKKNRTNPPRPDVSMPIVGIGHNNPPAEIYVGKMAVIGSRSFQNFRFLCEVLDEYLKDITELISGGADGADKMGARWARKRGIETRVFEPNHKKYKQAYHHRNRLIAEACDFVVAFWDGSSTGTKYTIDYARRIGKPVKLIRF